MISLMSNIILSVFGGWLSYRIILEYIPIFIQRKLCGYDQCKREKRQIPEPVGIISAAVYLVVLFVFIPFPFYDWSTTGSAFHYEKFLIFLSAMIGICSAVLLGFADDVLDLRWRHKLLFPSLSSLPLLLVYHASGSSTTILVPICLRNLLPVGEVIDIGLFYYIYMGMMIVFCTNAINILAGINGLEAGQALVIAISVAIFNIIQLNRLESEVFNHSVSLYFMFPFITTCSVLLYFNWYPSSVFVGDTFCYWAGMTLASTCILGHFSKTMALFVIPQVFNFIYSLPQLFHLIPCPRHRLPRYSAETDKLDMSTVEFKIEQISLLGRIILRILGIFRLIHHRCFEKDGETWWRINNLTLINLVLKIVGPMHEENLTLAILLLQAFCSLLAFFIRFILANLFFDVVN